MVQLLLVKFLMNARLIDDNNLSKYRNYIPYKS